MIGKRGLQGIKRYTQPLTIPPVFEIGNMDWLELLYTKHFLKDCTFQMSISL